MEEARAVEKTTRHMRKKRVDEMLIEPIKAMGMRKQHRFRVEDQAAFLEKLRSRLAYLSAEGLAALRPIVEGAAMGARKNVWPDLVSIVNWAKSIEAVPDVESEMITSYMASAAGRRAWERAPELAMALHGFMRRCGRPPNDYAWQHDLDKSATEMRRRVLRVRELIMSGKARPDELELIEAYERHKAHVEKLVYPQAVEGVANEG